MKRRLIFRSATLAFASALITLLPGCQTTRKKLPETSKMNILFINIDDLNAETIGCYDSPLARTPTIDKLAKEGVQFTRAYCNAVECGPSRASFATGLRPVSSKVLRNQDKIQEVASPDAPRIGKLLKQKGATIGANGRFYHINTAARGFIEYFDDVITTPRDADCPDQRFHYSPDPDIEADMLDKEKQRNAYTLDYPAGSPMWRKGFNIWHPLYMELVGDCGKPDECTWDGRVVRGSAEKIRQYAKEGKQFFFSVGLQKPHAPLIAPLQYIDMHNPDDFELDAPPEKDRNIPECAKRFGKPRDIFTGRFDHLYPQMRKTPENQKRAKAAYYGCVSFMDEQVKVLLDALEDAGIADQTIVIFFGDHGFHLGEHGLWSKATMFEQVTRVPLIIKIPGMPGNGRKCQEIVELIDLLPTMLEGWDLEIPPILEGSSLMPLLSDPEGKGKDAAYITTKITGSLANTVRTKRYRYTEWSGVDLFERELYDLEADPHEHVNQVNNPEFKAVVDKLSGLLNAL
jgi:arylsulfatase A-like enzyme